jgi:hypothetical protein
MFLRRYDVGVSRLLLCVATVCAGGFPVVATPSSRCSVELMERPIYPPLAIQARRPAVVTARVTVGADGYLSGELLEGDRLFGPTVLASIGRSRLSPADCAFEMFAVVYRFEIRGEETHGYVSNVIFHSPAEFVITARPMVVHWSGTDSPDAPSRCSAEFVERPQYPRLWEKARIQGSVNAHITVASDGLLSGNVSGSRVLFVQAVEEALRRTRFSAADCSGAQFDLVFRFVLEAASPGPARPGEIEIVAKEILIGEFGAASEVQELAPQFSRPGLAGEAFHEPLHACSEGLVDG